uniref:Uncharacterized protein n=1 Tax=Arundo donax TaxID=35708 RepID=A0A0A8Z236_ARUDO
MATFKFQTMSRGDSCIAYKQNQGYSRK